MHSDCWVTLSLTQPTKLQLSNSRSTSLRLYLEPWAEELELESKTTITIEQEDTSEDGRLEIETIDEGAVLYGNLACKLRIQRDGRVIWESYDAPGGVAFPRKN